MVAEAFARQDLALPKDKLFPIEVHWKPKSESIGRILQAWNIAADSVVFIDDSAMELGEAKAAHPGLHCLSFPKNDAQALDGFLRELRNLFAKSALSDDDALRLESLRQGARLREDAADAGGDTETFLESLQAEITFGYTKDPPDPRALDLVNKTNQFNLNGRRHTDGSWLAHLESPCAFLTVTSYRDKYGPLGKIAALSGQVSGDELRLQAWVMSCRAFSRRIEYRSVAELFDYFQVGRILFEFAPTARNGPVQTFLAEFFDGALPAEPVLSREQFLSRVPRLYDRAQRETSNE